MLHFRVELLFSSETFYEIFLSASQPSRKYIITLFLLYTHTLFWNRSLFNVVDVVVVMMMMIIIIYVGAEENHQPPINLFMRETKHSAV